MSRVDYGVNWYGTFNQLLGLLERLEGYGETQKTSAGGDLAGKLYSIEGHPAIGYGFDLKDDNSLAAILDGILLPGSTDEPTHEKRALIPTSFVWTT